MKNYAFFGAPSASRIGATFVLNFIAGTRTRARRFTSDSGYPSGVPNDERSERLKSRDTLERMVLGGVLINDWKRVKCPVGMTGELNPPNRSAPVLARKRRKAEDTRRPRTFDWNHLFS